MRLWSNTRQAALQVGQLQLTRIQKIAANGTNGSHKEVSLA